MDHEFTENQAYARHLLHEHRRLHQIVKHVEESWRRAGTGGDAGMNARLLAAVEELRSELADHFAEEESGGVLEEAVARVPDLGAEVSRLTEQHPSLLRDLDEVIAGLHAADGTGRLPTEIQQQFQRFTKRLRDHEAAENRVLSEGLGIEVN